MLVRGVNDNVCPSLPPKSSGKVAWLSVPTHLEQLFAMTCSEEHSIIKGWLNDVMDMKSINGYLPWKWQ